MRKACKAMYQTPGEEEFSGKFICGILCYRGHQNIMQYKIRTSLKTIAAKCTKKHILATSTKQSLKR